MRFITEFELDVNIDTKKLDHLIPDKKGIRELGVGKEIGMAFGWRQNGKTTPAGSIVHHFSLEIEAFPMDKWIEFKNKLIEHIGAKPGDQIGALQLIKDFEF